MRFAAITPMEITCFWKNSRSNFIFRRPCTFMPRKYIDCKISESNTTNTRRRTSKTFSNNRWSKSNSLKYLSTFVTRGLIKVYLWRVEMPIFDMTLRIPSLLALIKFSISYLTRLNDILPFHLWLAFWWVLHDLISLKLRKPYTGKLTITFYVLASAPYPSNKLKWWTSRASAVSRINPIFDRDLILT